MTTMSDTQSTYSFRVGGFLFSLTLPQWQDVSLLLPSFSAFRCEPEPDEPQLFTFTTEGQTLCLTGSEQMIEQSESDLGLVGLWRSADGYIMQVRHTADAPSHTLLCNDDFTHMSATLHWADPMVSSVLSSMLRMAFAQAILPHGAISLHAAAVVLSGNAYLFMGQSGTGKSTHARLWQQCFPGCLLLNDDNPMLRLHDGQVWAYGTPWSGKTPCYRSEHYRVQGIVRLAQAPHNRFLPAAEVEAFSLLLPGISVIGQHERYYQLMADTLAQVALTVRVGALECLPDEAAARLCAASLA